MRELWEKQKRGGAREKIGSCNQLAKRHLQLFDVREMVMMVNACKRPGARLPASRDACQKVWKACAWGRPKVRQRVFIMPLQLEGKNLERTCYKEDGGRECVQGEASCVKSFP